MIKMKIEKKIWPKFFEEVIKGNKNFELRLADFECRPGDVLILKEWNPETKEYTGRVIEKKVGYVSKIKELKFWTNEEIEKYGLQVIGLK